MRIALRLRRAICNDGLRWSKRFADTATNVCVGETRVLVATSVAGHLASLNMEGLLAKALTARGADVSALLCDHVLPACMDCEHRLYPTARARRTLVRHGPRELCISCTDAGTRLYGDLGIPVHLYSQYLSEGERAQARSTAESVPVDKVRDYIHDGMSVGEHAYAGTLRFLARGDLGQEPYAGDILRRYFEAALLTVFMMQNLLARQRYDVCVFNHGIYVPQGLISEVCRRHGIRVVTWNPAYRKSCFIFSHGDTYHHTLLNEPAASWENLDWSEAIERRLMDYLKSRWEGSRDWIWFHDRPVYNLSAIEREFGIDFARPTIGLLTNVVWDAQLHYPANAFQGILEWVTETIRWFGDHPELQLIIRVHPAEIRGTLPSRQRVTDEIVKVFPQLPRNVFVISPENQASTYAVMEKCNAVIIYGTKTGVELTSMGIPVIVAGEAWVRNKGLTVDVSSLQEYQEALNRLPFPERMNPDTVIRARKYAYHFFFRRMIPLPFMHPRKGWPPFFPNVCNQAELRPGVYPGLDVICNGVLHGSEFIFPDELLGQSDAVRDGSD